jgi:hypothetical protein
MYEKQNFALLTRVLPLLAFALLAGGCNDDRTEVATKDDEPTPAEEVLKDIDPSELPLLVVMQKGTNVPWCPVAVVQIVASCPANINGKPMDVTNTACRKKSDPNDKKNWISWVSVTGTAPPYMLDPGLGAPPFPEFEIVFKDSLPSDDPNVRKEKDPTSGACKTSRHGVVRCKINPNPPKVSDNEYPYSVYPIYNNEIRSVDCRVDPRIYVD